MFAANTQYNNGCLDFIVDKWGAWGPAWVCVIVAWERTIDMKEYIASQPEAGLNPPLF